MGDIRRRATTALVTAALALAPVAARIAAADGLAVDDAYLISEDSHLVVPSDGHPGLLDNDTGGSLVLCVASFDSKGLIGTIDDPGVKPDGSFTYTPPPNFNGMTTFKYEVGTLVAGQCPAPPTGEGTATVTITVTALNDAPSAAPDTFTALKDRTLTVAAPGVLGNDSDVDGDTLTAIKKSSPAHGVVTLAQDGGFSYTPNTGYVGPDQFSYAASDGTAESQQQLVTLHVVAVPPPPTPVPTATPAPTASPEPSPTESPAPSESELPSPSPLESGQASLSPSPGPVTAPVSGQGGLPLVAIGALALFLGLVAIAAIFFVRGQRLDSDVAETGFDDVDDPGP